jgi:predicted dehydrogenase
MFKLAIVGLGAWGRRLVDSVQGESESVRFSTAVVARPEKSSEYAAARGLKLVTDLQATFDDPAIDGVVSCGPAQLHAAHSLQALEAGKPVLAIKPLAVAAKDAEQLAAAAARKGVLLALGYNRCFFPNVVDMRKRLRAGALGRLLHAEGDFCVDRYRGLGDGSWKVDPKCAPAGSLGDHVLYLTIETLGPVAEAYAVGHRHDAIGGVAGTTAALLRTTGGQSALLTAIGVTADYFRFQLFGEKGWIELRDARRITFRPIGGEPEEVTLPAVDAERLELEAFAAAARGERAFPTPVADAVHSVAVIEAIDRSALDRRPTAVG